MFLSFPCTVYIIRMKTSNFVSLGFSSCIAPLKVFPRRQQFCCTCYRISSGYFSILSASICRDGGLGGGVNEVTFLQCFPLFSAVSFSSVLERFPAPTTRVIFSRPPVSFFPALCHFPCFLSLCKDFKPLKQPLSSFVCLLIFAAYIGGRRRQFTFKFDQATGDSS